MKTENPKREQHPLEKASSPEKGDLNSPSSDTPYPAPFQAWYMVGILTIAYVFSFVDRQILNLLVEPIRADLQISDTQMSLLMGFSFAVFYTFFGLPLGRLADSKNRRTIIAIGVAFWSLMTACCGVAQKYWHLLICRMGVGAGEATLSPCAYSLIADSFPREKRGSAIGFYCMGIHLGSGLASILGGMVVGFASNHGDLTVPMLGTIRPWQLIFFIVGLPGLLFSLLMFTFKEPARHGASYVKGAKGESKIVQVSVGELTQYMRDNWKTFFCHYIGFTLLTFSNYATAAWVPTLFIRRYGWTAKEIGMVLGAITMIVGPLGGIIGGRLCDWMTKKGYRDAPMRIGLILVVAWFPTGMLYPLMTDAWWCVVFLIPTVFFTSMPFGVSSVAIQEIVPNTMRGQASAIYLFVLNLIGLGLGPTGIALLTDYVFRDNNAVHYSVFVLTTLAHIVATVLLFLGLKPFVRSLDYLKEWNKNKSASA